MKKKKAKRFNPERKKKVKYQQIQESLDTFRKRHATKYLLENW